MSDLVNLANGSIDDLVLVTDQWQYDQHAPDHHGEYLGKQCTYWCESCQNPHQIGLTINGQRYKHGASWEWNGRVDSGITLSPSQLHRSYRYPHDGSDQDKADFDAVMEHGKRNQNSFDALVQSRFRQICHTFIGINGAPPGHIIWLGDCFSKGAPRPMCGQVKPLLARKDWPGTHGRSWAKIGERA
jgi:hypothetical protein